MTKRRVLLISYWFPPAGGIAVQRALSLAKYLPDYGCEVHVLTPSNPPSPVPDPSLLDQVPEKVKVHRCWTPAPPSGVRKLLWRLASRGKSPAPKTSNETAEAPAKSSALSNLMRRILCPDPEVLWVPFATRRALKIARRYNIDSVIVTAPPFSAFLIGNALKRKLPHLQLISDFRDEWLRFFLSTFSFHKNDAIKHRAETIERETVELSDTVVSITGRVVDELRERYHEQPGRKFVHIPNGYDPQIFKGFQSRRHDLSKVVVSYVGTVYSTTSPKSYLQALASLPEDIRSRIETRFIGRIADDQLELLESDSSVKLLGYMKQGDALKLMEETDFLLVVMQDPNFATGKIYEYLASGKPIVALSPDGGEVAKTIEETGAGWCLDPSNISGIASLLRKLATGEVRDTGSRNEEAIRSYERPRLAAKFAALMSTGAKDVEKPNVPEVASIEAGV